MQLAPVRLPSCVSFLDVDVVGVHVSGQHRGLVYVHNHKAWVVVVISCDAACDSCDDDWLFRISHAVRYLVRLKVSVADGCEPDHILEALQESSETHSKLVLTVLRGVMAEKDGKTTVSLNL